MLRIGYSDEESIVAENIYEASRRMCVEMQTETSPNSEGVVLFTTKRIVVVQVDTVLDDDVIHARRTSTANEGVLPRRSFHLLNIDTGKESLCFPKLQQMAKVNFLPTSVFQNIFEGPSPYPSVPPVTDIINVVYYKQKTNTLQ